MTQDKNHPGHEEPTARWIVGQDAFGAQDYIVHLRKPAFAAKVSHDPDTGVLSGLSYATGDGRNIYDFLWFDEAPTGPAFHELMAEAENTIATYLTETAA